VANQDSDAKEQIQLARRAALGDANARAKINTLIHPIINFQTSRFCKRFCRENQYRYICTLESSINARSSMPDGAQYCEWGNASYAWMLNDLVNSNRLNKFEAKNGAQINHYLYHIANSLPFYERWKDWRFGQRVHVPTYIQELHPNASDVFLALRSNEEIPAIAQRLGHSEEDIKRLSKQIIVSLTQKKKLYLLDPPKTVSLGDMNPEQDDSVFAEDADIAIYDEAPEDLEVKQALHNAWGRLSAVEQFVLEAMLIEEQDALDILAALTKMNISIKQGVTAAETTRQQLYYFRRKCLAKLALLMEEK